MKKRLILSMLCVIGLCLILACGGPIDATTGTATASAAENPDINIDESELQFLRNQSRSFSILEEAMAPFRKGDDTGEESQIYCDSFAGVYLDDYGRLNIGVVQAFITEQVEISMNSLIGQVIYWQKAFSYNFLAKKMNAFSEEAMI